MKPSSQVQSAIEALDEIIASARNAGPAADAVLRAFFQRRRYAGSGDRRAIRELVYRAIRRSGELPVSGRAAMLGVGQDDPDVLALFDWSVKAPVPPIAGEPVAEAQAVPAWLMPKLDPLIDPVEIPLLLERAPLDLRVNRLKGDRASAQALLPDAQPTPLAPFGLRLSEHFAVDTHEAYTSGLVEVQDEGSQLGAIACAVRPDYQVVDLCAGAGGKTLALAADMVNRGRILACDVDSGRLSRLAPRAERAGATVIETRKVDPQTEVKALSDWRGRADLVLVDAPCSSSGTWRRNPETRWRLTEERLQRTINIQAQLLDLGSMMVRPGGHLVYVVCSILSSEGRDQAAAFQARRAGFTPEEPPFEGGRPSGSGRLLTPGHDGTDGFFVARWRRAS